jgi:hypothetical protein
MVWTDNHYGVNKFILLVNIATYDVVSWVRGVFGEFRNETAWLGLSRYSVTFAVRAGLWRSSCPIPRQGRRVGAQARKNSREKPLS